MAATYIIYHDGPCARCEEDRPLSLMGGRYVCVPCIEDYERHGAQQGIEPMDASRSDYYGDEDDWDTQRGCVDHIRREPSW